MIPLLVDAPPGLIFELVASDGSVADAFPSNSGPGGNTAPFRGEYYVDPTFVGTSTGSASNPFTTIAAAFAAGTAQGIANGIVHTASITENVVFPQTGNWEIRGLLNGWYVYGVTITGTIDLSSASPAARYVALTDLQVTGLVSGNLPDANASAVARFTNVAFEGGVSLTGAKNRAWAAIFQGLSLNGGSQGYGGYVEGGPTNVKGRIWAQNYQFFSAVTSSVGANSDGGIWFDACGCGSQTITLSNPTPGFVHNLVLVDSNIGGSNVVYTGAAIPAFTMDSVSIVSNVTITGGSANMPTTFGYTFRVTANTNNRGVQPIVTKHPSPAMLMLATLTLVTPGTAGNAVLNATYTDSLGVARTKPVTPPLNIAGAAGDEVQGQLVFTQNGAGSIGFNVTGITTAGALSYNLSMQLRPAM